MTRLVFPPDSAVTAKLLRKAARIGGCRARRLVQIVSQPAISERSSRAASGHDRPAAATPNSI